MARFYPVVLILLMCIPVSGTDLPTVALTTTVPFAEHEAQQNLAATFTALLELNVSQSSAVAVVERMQLELALQEMVISRGLRADDRDRPQVGKLATADFILNASFLRPDEESGLQLLLVRIVEANTGRLRGITVAPIDELTIDDSAAQIARYLANVIETPQQSSVTVAVGAFESAGRFDRLRPLEVGVRDMLTTGLLNVSRFQVLQRSDMKELLQELDLIQAGLADRTDLPDTLTRRAAAYLVRGTLSEQHADGAYKVIVETKIVHARSSETVHELRSVAAPQELPEKLSKHALQIAAFLIRASKLPENKIRQPLGRHETDQLLGQVLSDLDRFRRRSPIDFSFRDFPMPGTELKRELPHAKQQTMVNADSALGTHLLRKSIDRLETILFIQPDHPVAAVALGFCYSHHINQIKQTQRGATLLKKVFEGQPESELAVSALQLYSEISFHHHSGSVDPALRKTAAEQLRYAFENMPLQYRTYRWARMLELLRSLYVQDKDFDALEQTIHVAGAMIDSVDDQPARRKLTMAVSDLAVALCRERDQTAVRDSTAIELLTTWSQSDDKLRHHAGHQGLAAIAASAHDYLAAAEHYQAAAASYAASDEGSERYAKENLLIHAARNLRLAGRPSESLKLLESFHPSWAPTSLNRGYRDLERGICLAMLGDNEKALRIWVTAAEEVPHLVDNSDVEDRIVALGGVPLSEIRDIDVRYLSRVDGRRVHCHALATNGSRLFCGDGFQSRSVLAYDISADRWETIGENIGHISCLAYGKGALWVGTSDNGLWRCELVGNLWQHYSSEHGLPDLHVESITVDGDAAYVGVGTAASGGLVRVDRMGNVHVFDSPGAPHAAPTHVIVRDDRVSARTQQSIYEYDIRKGCWQRLLETEGHWNPAIFAGQSTIWASRYGNELYKFDRSGAISDEFRQAWFPVGQQKAGYRVRFVIEIDNQIWFGGSPWARFKSSGLYRLDGRTGEFFLYGPRDGFRTGAGYETYDGVWAEDRMWLATSSGLAEVTRRTK